MSYMMVMQFIVTTIVMALLGFYVGQKLNPESDLSTILTGVGLGLGVIIGFVTLIYMMRSEERYERSTRH